MSEYKLKECPFCGGEAKVRKKWGHWTVYCLDCCASSDRYVPGGTYYESSETKDEAVERWDTRAEQTCKDVCAGISEFTCSVCGFDCDLTSWISLFDGDSGRHKHHHHGTPNYCPNCGAKVVEQ